MVCISPLEESVIRTLNPAHAKEFARDCRREIDAAMVGNTSHTLPDIRRPRFRGARCGCRCGWRTRDAAGEHPTGISALAGRLARPPPRRRRGPARATCGRGREQMLVQHSPPSSRPRILRSWKSGLSRTHHTSLPERDHDSVTNYVITQRANNESSIQPISRAELEVRIQSPPADSLVSRRNPPSTSKSGGFPRVLRLGAADAVGRDTQNSATPRQWAIISLTGHIPVPQRQ
jgi:hypothetical protein